MDEKTLPTIGDPMFEPTKENMQAMWQEMQTLYGGMMELTGINKEIIEVINNQSKWNEDLIKKLRGKPQKDRIILP